MDGYGDYGAGSKMSNGFHFTFWFSLKYILLSLYSSMLPGNQMESRNGGMTMTKYSRWVRTGLDGFGTIRISPIILIHFHSCSFTSYYGEIGEVWNGLDIFHCQYCQ